MLDQEWKEIASKATAKKNLTRALQAIGLLIAYYLFNFLRLDLYLPHKKPAALWYLAAISLACCLGAFAIGIPTFIRSIKSLRTNRDTRNYLAVILTALIVLNLVYWIVTFLYFLYIRHR